MSYSGCPTLSEGAASSKSGVQNHDRWSSERNYMMAAICWTAGLGNCWRFLVIAAQDGTGAFIVPFLLTMVLIGIPLTYMEIGIGQFSSEGPIAVWSLCPLLRGIGVGSMCTCMCIMVYYNMVNAYLLYFSFASLNKPTPWSMCGSWAKEYCYALKSNASTRAQCALIKGDEYCDALPWEDSAQHYWMQEVLDFVPIQPNTGLGHLQPRIVFCSLATTFIIFLANSDGIRSIEKMLYFMAAYPYIGMAALIFVSFLDPGAGLGLSLFLTPNFPKMQELKTWRLALEQVLFSMGIGLGGFINLGSYSHFRSPAHRTAIIMNLIDLVTSLGYGVIMFNAFGAVSFNIHAPLKTITEMRSTMLFAKLPTSMLFLKGYPQVWGALFFTTAYTLGVRSEAIMLSTVVVSMYDYWPNMRRYSVSISLIAACSVFLLGLPLCTQMGSTILNYVDNTVASPELLLMVFLEIFAIVGIYGLHRFVDDLHFMLGFRPNLYWQICWFCAPFYILAMWVHSMLELISGGENPPPVYWVYIMQWSLFALPILCIVTLAIFKVCQTFDASGRRPRLWRAVCKAIEPSLDWGPKNITLRKSRDVFSKYIVTKEFMYRLEKFRADRHHEAKRRSFTVQLDHT